MVDTVSATVSLGQLLSESRYNSVRRGQSRCLYCAKQMVDTVRATI